MTYQSIIAQIVLRIIDVSDRLIAGTTTPPKNTEIAANTPDPIAESH